MKNIYQTLSHVQWECKYHVVIVPKYRKKILYGQVRQRVGQILRSLAQQKDVEIIEGFVCIDHVHMVISIPPKYSIAMVIGFMKGKSAIRIHQEFSKHYKSYHGKHFWSRGYFVSTVGLDEEMIKKYVRNQEKTDKLADGQELDLNW
jgi:putative transposase